MTWQERGRAKKRAQKREKRHGVASRSHGVTRNVTEVTHGKGRRITLETALKMRIPRGVNNGRTMQSLTSQQLQWYAENWEDSLGTADAALLVWEDRTKDAPEPVRAWDSRPATPLTTEAQATGELKSILEAAKPGLF